MKKSIVICAFLFPFTSFSQVDLSVDSIFQRMGLWGQITKGLDFYEVPLDRKDTISFSALVSNIGLDTATNVVLDVAIFKDGLFAYMVSSGSQNLCGGCSDSISVSNQYLNQPGTYKFVYMIDSDSLDINLTNNQDSLEVTVSYDGSHRRDNGSIEFYSDSIPGIVGDGNPQEIGNIYEAYTDVELNKVKFRLANDPNQVSNLIYISIWTKSPQDSLWQWKTQSSDYTLTASDCNGGEVMIYFEGACIEQGDLYAVMFGHYAAGYVDLAYAQAVDYGSVLYGAYSTGSNFEHNMLQNPRAVHVYPFYDGWDNCYLSIDEYADQTLTFQISPNPSNQNTNIQYQLQSNAVVELTLSDLSGRQIRKEHLGNQISGSHTYQLDVTDLQSGVYLLTLQAGDQQKSQKLIISK